MTQTASEEISMDLGHPAPLTPIQKGIWATTRLGADHSSAYNMPYCFELKGRLNVDALNDAVQAVGRRYPQLTWRVTTEFGEPHFEPSEQPIPFVMHQVDYPDATAEAGMDLIRSLANHTFDLGREGPCRVDVVTLSIDHYLLSVLVHHVVFDGASAALFFGALSEAFAGELGGSGEGLPDTGFVAYAEELADRVGSGGFDDGVGFWSETLAGAPTVFGRVGDYGDRGEAVRVGVSLGELSGDVRELARREGVTLFMLLLAVFNVALFRLSGSRDILVGSPMSTRSSRFRETVGCFLNTVVLRSAIDEGVAFRELLHGVRRTVSEAIEHRDVPFELVLDALEVKRSASHPPLVQAVLSVGDAWGDHLALTDVEVVPLDIMPSVWKSPIELTFHDSDYIELQMASDGTLLDENAAGAMLGLIVRSLENLCKDHDQSTLTSTGSITRSPVTTIVATSTPKAEPLTEGVSVLEAFFDHADNRPDHPAIIDGRRTISYGELRARASACAAELRASGVGPEQPIVLQLERSAEFIIGALGTMLAGGLYVPVDPEAPSARLQRILEIVQPVRHVTAADFWSERGEQALGGLSACVPIEVERPSTCVGGAAAAYMIFTSGSTGDPKGVVVTRDNLDAMVRSITRPTAATANDVWGMAHSSAFDVSVFEMWLPLTTGGTIAVLSPQTVRDPNEMTQAITDAGITVLSQTPSAYGMLDRHPGFVESFDRTSLRLVVFGGEMLKSALVARTLAAPAHAPVLLNMYGITETTVHVTCHRAGPGDLDLDAVRTGLPHDGMGTKLYWEGRDPTIDGFVGEICVSGIGVSRGYWGNPRSTATKFVPDPNGPPGARMYRSGDAGRRRGSDAIEYLGRMDQQVKIRGFRIEIGEIEAALRRIATVSEAACVVETIGSSPTLVAYVIAAGSETATLSSEDLAGALMDYLPSYMIPRIYRLVSRMPLTVNGKLDRKRLAVEPWTSPDTAQAMAPSSDVERLLARTWGRHLGLDADQVAVDRSFFALGGDSLSAVSIIEDLIRSGYDVSTSDLIAARTIQKLAMIMGKPSAPREAAAPPEPFSLVSKSDRDALANDFGDALVDAFPTSALQMAMMFHMRTSGTRQDYHNVTSFEIGSRLVAQRLVNAIHGVTQRFDALRTSFDLASYSDPLQLIWRNVTPSVAVHDAVALGRPMSDIVDHLMASEVQAAFDPTSPPLLRWNIILDEGRTTVLVTEFHPILDGWSLHTVLRDVFSRYAASATGGLHPPEQAEPAAFGMAAHVRREQQARDAPEVARYWSERVGSMPDTKVGPSQPDPDRRTIGTTRPIPDETWQAVIEVARALDVRPSSVFLAAHLSVLSARTAQPVVTSGVVHHTRPDLPGAVDAVGLFMNSLPVSGDVRHSWADLVAEVDSQITSNWDARMLPLVDVKSIAGWSDVPFDATFNFVDFRVLHDYVDDESDLELQGGPHSEPSNFAYQLLITAPRLRIGADDRRATVTLEVHAPPFEQRNLDELVTLYMVGLSALVEDPTTSPAEAARLGTSELVTVLARNGVDDPSLENRTIVETIMHNLEHRGDALAVVDGDVSATYNELSMMVVAARQRLVDNGCRPGDVIGLRSGPGIGAIVSIIAIWTCRAAFVVLDPGWPANRVKQIVDDCCPRLVLCAADEMPDDDDDLLAATPHHSFDLGSLGEISVASAQATAPTGGELAYLMYTSGSTGRPKGVLVPHRGLANYMLWSLDAYGYATAQRTPVQSAISADLIFPSLFGPLVAGTTVEVIRHRFGGVLGLAKSLNDGAVYSMIKATPSQLEVISGATAPGVLFDIGTVVVGAEACTPATAEKIRSMVGEGTPVLNEYGPTETVVGCSTYPLRDAASERSVLPLGAPIANMAMYVLDEQRRPMRPGAPGELVIGGEGVAWGYLHQPRITAARFVPDPFSAKSGARMYCSGDLAAYSGDVERNIEFLGRIDGQLKIHGYRVEPSEVEAILRNAPGVTDACVHPSSNGGLTAHLAETPDTTIDLAVVDSFAAEWLPRYMVPSRYSVADHIPLTPAGKVDYGTLSERRLHRAGGAHRDPAAEVDRRSPSEPEGTEEIAEAIRAAWSDAVGSAQEGTDFFSAGGNAAKLSAFFRSVRRRRGRDVVPRDRFLEAPTLSAAIAAATDEAAHPRRAAATNGAAVIRAEETKKSPKSGEPIMSSDLYVIVVNDEEQYSIWRSDTKAPSGWHTIGDPRPESDCLDEIERLWTDMRPKSVRVALGEA